MGNSKILIGLFLYLISFASGCDSTMKLTGNVPSFTPKENTQHVLEEYLTKEHSFISTHQTEVFFLIKFPSCTGSIDRIYSYLEESQYSNRVHIMGIKDFTSPLTQKFEPYIQSVHTKFTADHEVFGQKTGIRVGYPEMYYFVNGHPTSRRVVNCNNFDDAIDSAEAFLQQPPMVLTANG